MDNKFIFNTFSNDAEYIALFIGMEIYDMLGAEYFKTFSDSQLVVSQMKGKLVICP